MSGGIDDGAGRAPRRTGGRARRNPVAPERRGIIAGSRKRLGMSGNDSKDRGAKAHKHRGPASCSQGLLAGRAPAGAQCAMPDSAVPRFRYNRSRVPRPPRRDPSRHADRRSQCRREGPDPRRGAAVHPALPRQDDHRQVRRQRHDRACAEGRFRPRRRDAEARRDEPGHRPRRRPADRRPAQEDGHRERVPPGHARDRRARDERRRNGAGRAEPGNRRPHQPARRQGRRPHRPGRRVHPRAQDAAEERRQAAARWWTSASSARSSASTRS